MIHIPPSTITCVGKLLEQVPELRSVYDEHIHDNDELLPHMFFGDVTRYVVQQVHSGEMGPSTPVGRIFDSLERFMAFGDDQVKELVSVSFIENLAAYDDVLTVLRGLLGPNLEKELKNHGK
jgi:hypothetical protein